MANVPYVPTVWVDDDGSGAVGTVFNAARMNKIEQGVKGAGIVPNGGAIGQALVKQTAADQDTYWTTIGGGAIPLDIVHYVGGVGEPAFINSWVNYDNNAPTPGTGAQRSLTFRKDPFGKVSIFGCIKGGASGSVIFTLPAGYRPRTSVIIAAYAGAFGYIGVDANGAVTAVNVGTSNINGFVMLDAVEFDSESVTTLPTGPQGIQGIQGPVGGNATIPMDTVHVVNTSGEPAFLNSWSNYDTTRVARFRKDPLGKVRLSGIVKGGAVGSIMFRLPAGYLPARGQQAWSTVANGAFSDIEVAATGDVFFVGGNSTFVYLDGVEFDTETVTQMPTGPRGATGANGAGGFVGQICASGLKTIPAGWLLCDNTALLPGNHPTLRALLLAEGSIYGTWVDGVSPLLPGLTNRFIYGAVNDFGSVGARAGSTTAPLVVNNLPSHSHTGATGTDTPDHYHVENDRVVILDAGGGAGFLAAGGPRWAFNAPGTIGTYGAQSKHQHAITPEGGGVEHPNMPPYMALYHLIYAGD